MFVSKENKTHVLEEDESLICSVKGDRIVSVLCSDQHKSVTLVRPVCSRKSCGTYFAYRLNNLLQIDCKNRKE